MIFYRLCLILFFSLLLFHLEVESKEIFEVSILFLGSEERDPEYQVDLDYELKEITDLTRQPLENLQLSVLRDFNDHYTTYFVSKNDQANFATIPLSTWSLLFFKPPKNIENISVGKINYFQKQLSKSILHSQSIVKDFFHNSFKMDHSKRILILVGHGNAYEGFESLNLKELRSTLETNLPTRNGKPLDILWMNSCFMSSIEVVYEIRQISNLFIGSQEAEFTKGQPLESLNEIFKDFDNDDELANALALQYLKSYSILSQGSQSSAVDKSSATISVINTSKLEPLIKKIKSTVQAIRYHGTHNRLTQEQREAIKRVHNNRQMKRDDLVDLGSLFLKMKEHNSFHINNELKYQIKEVTDYLRLKDSTSLRTLTAHPNTHLRIKVMPSQQGHWMVFGFNDWRKGDENDYETLNKMDLSLKKNLVFIPGPHKKKWPARFVNKKLYLYPFSAGLNKFHYYFIKDPNDKIDSNTIYYQYEQIRDYFWSKNDSSSTSPIIFFGYTQGIGKKGEFYTGLSVFDPSFPENLKPIYFQNEFNQITNWSAL